MGRCLGVILPISPFLLFYHILILLSYLNLITFDSDNAFLIITIASYSWAADNKATQHPISNPFFILFIVYPSILYLVSIIC